ncbi:hypothetical protein P9209_07085 [Prescottella defluvii]|nr:hypothetical protein P9209_07085 [Prescottella defluvii]
MFEEQWHAVGLLQPDNAVPHYATVDLATIGIGVLIASCATCTGRA